MMDKAIPVLYNKKEECCGCTACYASCPVGAIAMWPDAEGFLYPIINGAICIRCGRCETVCSFSPNSSV